MLQIGAAPICGFVSLCPDHNTSPMASARFKHTNRTNAVWLEQLEKTGPARGRALTALRRILLAGLRRSLSGRAGANDAFLEDVVQEALVRTLDKLDQFEGRSRFTTWATSIAIRTALGELRRKRWQDVSLEEAVRDPLDASADPERQAQRSALVEAMYHVIDRNLTEKQRIALLAELGGMPPAEIGRRLGSNRNAIYKLTHDARKRLKEGLEAAGYDVSDVQTAFSR